MVYFYLAGGKRPKPPPPHQYIRQWQWRNEPKKLRGAQSLRGSVATERGEGVGGGCPPPPPTLGSFFIFRLEKCAIWGIPKKEIST